MDLLAAVGDFQPAVATGHFRALAKADPVLEMSVRTGVGMDAWINWLVAQRAACKTQHG